MKPYSYQRHCLNALASARRRGRKRALVVMATGLGKTVVSAFEIQRLLKEAPGRVLYLCHNNHILKQARETFEEVLGDEYTYGYFHGTEKHMHRVDVLFASFQTMATWREAFLRDEFRYIVVDEVHHAHAATFRPTVEYFQPEWMVGLTATPERGDGLDIATLFGGGKPVYNLGLFKALARRYLCDVDYRLMTDEIQNAGVLDTPVGKLSIAELNRTIFIPKRDEEIVRIIGEKTRGIENPRVMIFCASIEHANRMSALMPHAAVVHSKLKTGEKNDRLDAFRSGDVDTILTVDMLNEGIDVPEANVIVFLRSTSSRTIFLQQLGRGLRKALGKLKVLVLDFVANCERIEMIDQLQQGVNAAGGSTATGPTSCGDGEDGEEGSREPLTLTLDGGEFDERLWKLVDVVRSIRDGYTKEMLTRQLLAKAVNGVMPTNLEVANDPKMAAPATFTIVFDTSWNGIAKELGLKPGRRYDYTKRELKAQLLAKVKDLGRVPSGREVVADPNMASLETFITVFQVKTFNEVLTQLDLKPVKVHAVHPPEALKSQMQEKIRVLGRVPTPAEVDADPRMASTATFYRAFCGDKWRWNVVLEACGSEGNIRGDYTRSKLEAQLRRKTKSLGRSPSIPDVRADPGMASPDTFMRIFGVKTWNDVLRAMGLQVNMKRYTTAMLTAQLLGKVQELGRTPTSNEVNADPNMATVNAFKRAFGMDWAGIIQLHGLTSYQQKYS